MVIGCVYLTAKFIRPILGTHPFGADVKNRSRRFFDKPHTISANGWRAEISYDANRNRYIRKDIRSLGGERKITHYLGAVEYIYELGKPVKAKRYIGHLVITIDDETTSRARWDFNYLLKDHIGSTHTVANRFGNAIVHMSFNAWGQRRTTPNFEVVPITQVWNTFGLGLRAQIDETTNRGFTGHEHYDQVGIIHMNGRIYDPSIGRFLQADPIIQDHYDTQSLNRYSYVMNNPLSYTDPTGYSRLRKGAIFNTVASIAIGVFLPGSTAIFGSSVQTGATFFSSAVTGAVIGAINTGNLKGAVKGGIFAAITFGIGHKFKGFDNVPGIGEEGSSARIFAHALVSGVSAEVDGGSFGHGFASAFLSQHIGKNAFFHKGGSTGTIVSNAILQGTISEITGGKFANGAISAAFRVAFNEIQVISTGTTPEQKEQRARKKDYEDFVESLSTDEKKALRAGFHKLKADHGLAEHFNDSRKNSVLGIGVFDVDGSFGFSGVSDDAIEGVLHNPPNIGYFSCFGRCQESIVGSTGLRLLIFRHPRGSKNMMEFHSHIMQNLSNQGNVPVILRDGYLNQSYLWRPEVDEH